MADDLAPPFDAPQHERAPRPLPLFLDMVRNLGARHPGLAARALRGLRQYASSPAPSSRSAMPVTGRRGGTTLHDFGGDGPPTIVVPSLINPPDILDLDDERSLCAALATYGTRVLLLDWGPAEQRRQLDLSAHVTDLLVPLLRELGEPAALLGYCLGGTLALGTAGCVPVRRVATLAAPWDFSAYPAAARSRFADLLRAAEPLARPLGFLPMEVLQSAFWSLDPDRIVAKYARFSEVDPGSPEGRGFVAVEDWANRGEPLPWPAAIELAETMFQQNATARGAWQINGTPIPSAPRCSALHLVATADVITPAGSAPTGKQWCARTGHIGLAIGQAARRNLHPRLFRWLVDGSDEG